MSAVPHGDARLLLPYIPADRQHAVATGGELPDRSDGAALFADLSGFTVLTQALASRYGPYRGAEELTRYLAVVYDALIGAVHVHRGAVIGFSGDAVTCWFGGDDGFAAITAGFAMQRALESLPPAVSGTAGETRLGVKVAVACGPARRFLVGDPQIQVIDVLAGRTIDRLAACEKLAQPGDVLLDVSERQTHRFEQSGRRTDPASGHEAAVLAEPGEGAAPNAWPRIDALEETWMQTWVLPPVRERILAGFNLLAADFRPSAALFLSFRGIDYDLDPAAGQKLDAFVRWVQGVVTRLGGALIQLTFGDKGSYLYSTFGAPIAHDNDAARAVAAADILRAPPQAWVREVKIGVTHGQMYAGAYGSLMRCSYGVLGAKTNLAARLMTAADVGEVLCDRETVQQARRHWTFRALPPIRVKGVEHDVAVFAPQQRIEGAEQRSGRVVGRTAELAALRGVLASLVSGAPMVVQIEGDAGIGKTRLLEAFGGFCTAEGVDVMAGGSTGLGHETAYRAWRSIVWRLLDLSDESVESRRERLPQRMASLAPDLAQWAPLLEDVLGVELPATELTHGLAPESRSRNLVYLLTELFRRRAAEAPVAVILDEAHHLDSVSWDLTVALARAASESRARLMIALAYRPAELDARGASALMTLGSASNARAVQLGELTPTDLAGIVAERFGLSSDDLPEALLELLSSRASGNPFFAEELVQMLLDDGSIRQLDDGGLELRFEQAAGENESMLPQSLHGLILARIDRSPAAARRTLKIASVVGRRFRSDLLQAAFDGSDSAPTPPGALGSYLDALTVRKLIAPLGLHMYRFPHVTLHQVAYGSILFAQRRQVHEAVAEWYEKNDELPARERAALLAHHYARAAEGSGNEGLIDKAVGALSETAEQNAQLGAFAEAASSYRTALELLNARTVITAQQEVLRVRLGDMLERLGEFEDAEGCYREALRTARNESTRSAALASLCLIHTRRGNYQEARTMGLRSLAIAEANGESTVVALARGRLGIIAALEGNLVEAEALFESTQRHYRELGQFRNAAAWLNNLGLGLVFQERFEEAGARLLEALQLTRRHAIQEVEAQVLMNLGLCAHKQGDLEQAADRYRNSLTLCRKLLAREGAVINVVNLGDIALARGEQREAWSAYLEAGQEALSLGALPRALDALRGAAEVQAAQEQFLASAETLGFVLAHPASNVEVEGEAERVLTTLRSHLSEEDLAAARERGAARSFEDVLVGLNGRAAL